MFNLLFFFQVNLLGNTTLLICSFQCRLLSEYFQWRVKLLVIANYNKNIQMLSKGYVPISDDKNIYRLSLKDYNRIKNWLKQAKRNYQPISTLSTAFEYYPLNYVYSFKKISLDEQFINKYVREINVTANNGLRILAGIEDSSRNIFVAKLYEKKDLFCNVDIGSRIISCLDDITLAFFTLDQRSAAKMGNIGPNLKNFNTVIQLQLASNKGEIFNLGSIKHCLSNRPRQAIVDLDLLRVGHKQKIGHIEFHIDTPQKLGLSYFIPPNVIIDQITIIPPCRKLQLKNKTTPYTLSQQYNIKLQNLSISINNYDKLLKYLQRCSPYFTEYHHDNIKMEIVRINFVVGFHNGWLLVNDLPGVHKDKSSPRHASPTKNISKVMNSVVEYKKEKSIYTVYNSIRLSLNAKKDENQRKVILQQEEIPMFVLNEKQTTEGMNLLYFDSDQGQLIGILQYTLKFTLSSTIKQQKTVKANAFWTPITFNTGEPACEVKIPMIEHIELPGYPIEWNKIQSNKEVSTQLSYQCINQNPQLHKNTRKQRLNSYTTIKPASDSELKSKSYLDLLMEQEEKQPMVHRVQTSAKIMTNASLVSKQEEANHHIDKMLRKIEKTLKPRLKLKQSRFNRQLYQNRLKSEDKVKGLSLVGKSFRIKFRLREYLPVTDCISQYYIPRKLTIQLYAFRQYFQLLAYMNKDTVKSGIPILLQNPNKMDYQGFIFEFNVNNIDQEEAGAFEDGNNVIAQIYDQENMLYYGGGVYPTIELFQEDHLRQQPNLNRQNSEMQQKYKHIKLQIHSKKNQNISKTYGFLLLQCTITPILPSSKHDNHFSQQIELSKVVKQMSTKQRQLLRIQTFTGKQQANTKKQQMITKYKQNNRFTNANEIVNKQYNNDLQLEYEIGKPTYQWLKLSNTDSSGNNMFTFHLDCDFVELVTDKTEYQRKVMADVRADKEKKVMPNLAYIVGKPGTPGYYEAKIPQGTQTDIMLKILNNQYYKTIKQTTIVNLQVKRNTFLYKKYKIRLNYKKPLIDRVYHMDILWNNNIGNDSIRIRLPDDIIEENGQYVGTLTMNTMYNSKEKILSIAKISEDSVGEVGLLVQVLMGVYFDKSLQYLRKTILLQIQCMQGEKAKVFLGDLQTLKIPICGQNMKVRDRIYRIQTSNDQYRLMWDSFSKLQYFSEMDKNQPELLLRCLWPKKDQLIVSLISLQGILIKKYMIQIQCTIPSRCKLQQLQVENYVGQKLVLVFKNPYYTDFPFYISSTTENIQFHGIEFENHSSQHENQFIFKIKARSHVRVTAQIHNNIRNQQYIVLSDYQHSVISIFSIKTIAKLRHILNAKGNLNIPDHISGDSQTSMMDNKMKESTPAFFGIGKRKITI